MGDTYLREIAGRIKRAIELSLLDQKVIADRIGVAENTLSNYATGKRMPKADVISMIAQTCDVNPAWLLTGEGLVRPQESTALTIQRAPAAYGRMVSADFGLLDPERLVVLPVYNLEMGAGSAVQSGNAEVMGHMAFLADWLREEAKINPKRGFIARVRGRSMEPEILDGDLVIGELTEFVSLADLRDDIYCVSYYDEILVKYVSATQDRVLLISANQRFPTIDIENPSDDIFRVIGRVVKKIGDV